jgi:hypothetical protein
MDGSKHLAPAEVAEMHRARLSGVPMINIRLLADPLKHLFAQPGGQVMAPHDVDSFRYASTNL